MFRRPLPLLVLFFASGTSALAYEVIWIRLLSLSLSITVYALSTVLAAFMAGLAFGAAIGARIADRLERPLLGFGLAELGLAVCGVTVPVILSNFGPAYIWLHHALEGGGMWLGVSRFLLAFSVLVIPATLMGITLPLLSRLAIDRPDRAGEGAGGLYGANTLGAVVGCVLWGFAVIPALGLMASSMLAA